MAARPRCSSPHRTCRCPSRSLHVRPCNKRALDTFTSLGSINASLRRARVALADRCARVRRAPLCRPDHHHLRRWNVPRNPRLSKLSPRHRQRSPRARCEREHRRVLHGQRQRQRRARGHRGRRPCNFACSTASSPSAPASARLSKPQRTAPPSSKASPRFAERSTPTEDAGDQRPEPLTRAEIPAAIKRVPDRFTLNLGGRRPLHARVARDLRQRIRR